MSGITALIADIQRASIHDGPGIRTTIFFKGCPLSCVWCHNPECISPKRQELFYPEKCIHCGHCGETCYAGARVLCGREMTADDLMDEIRLDKAYYAKEGGVTFSGGEPMLQKAMVMEVAKRCRAEKIHTAMETSMIFFDEAVFRQMDVLMCDLKVREDEVHKRYTGVSNRTIKEHIRALDELHIPFILRTPVVPGVNDRKEEIGAIALFARTLSFCRAYELLPYHPLGEEKRRALGEQSTLFPVPTEEQMKELTYYADLSR